jgi:hypothetical protein
MALLAMCIADPGVGREFIERLGAEHLSAPVFERARDWLAQHLAEPLQGLPRDDDQLVALVTQLVMSAEREPASRESMELNFLELELRAVEDRIAAAAGEGGPPVELQRRRAELADRLAGREAVPGG